MGANAAGAVQETHHRAVRWRKPRPRAAVDACCPGLAAGVSLQTLTLEMLVVLLAEHLLPSHGECLAHPGLVSKTGSQSVETETTRNVRLRSCNSFQEGHSHLSWTRSTHDISSTNTSRDLTPACAQMGQLLVSEKLGNAALRENYKHNEAISELPLTLGSVVAHSQPLVSCFKSRTLEEPTKWTFRNILACWRERLKPSQAVVPLGLM